MCTHAAQTQIIHTVTAKQVTVSLAVVQAICCDFKSFI